MFCSLATHFKQQDEALLVAIGVFVGPVQPVVRHMADKLLELKPSLTVPNVAGKRLDAPGGQSA